MAAVGNVTWTGTTGASAKPNGSLPFYMGDRWWMVTQRAVDSDLVIIGEDPTTGVWTDTLVETNDRTSDRSDVVPLSSASRIYVLGRHATTPEITSATLSGTTWTIDSNVNKVHVVGIDGVDECCLAIGTEWATPTLFAFDAPASAVNMRHSTNHGQTWGTLTTIADGTDGRDASIANVDAIDFSWDDGGGTDNYVGVFYGEQSSAGSQYGFVRIREGDDPTVATNWVHESIPLGDVTGPPNADNHVCITRDDAGRLYAGVKTGASGGTENVVFVRTNATSGAWSLHSETPSLASAARPCIAFDGGNQKVIFTGAALGASVAPAYWSCDPGLATTWTNQGPLFDDDAGGFFSQISAPYAPGTADTGIMFASGSAGDMWESYIEATGGGGSVGLADNSYLGLMGIGI